MEEFREFEISTYFERTVPKLRRVGAQWRGPCPVHRGKNDNFAVDPKSGRAHCFSKCGRGWDIVGLQMALGRSGFREAREEVYRIMGRESRRGKPIIAEYDYTDESGARVFQVVRFTPKGFAQRRRTAAGDWDWNVKGVRPLLYNLPAVRAAETVWVVEGEKDVQTLASWNLTATCNAGGAGKWKSAHAEFLRGKHVIILPDNDAPGLQHAARVAASLAGVAKAIKTIRLPVGEKGDITDWKEAGGTREQLLALVEDGQQTEPPAQQTAKFRVDDSGVYLCELRADWRIGPRLEIIARTRNADGEGWGRLVRFRNCEGEEKSCIIPMAELVGDGKEPLHRLLNLGYQPDRHRKSVEALKDYIYEAEPAQFIRCVATVGWHSGAFVLPTETIAPLEATEVILFNPEVPIEHKYRSAGSLESWRSTVAAWSRGNSRLVFAISCAFGAPLIPLLRADGGGFHFRGLSSTGKTTSLLAAGSVWGGSPHAGFFETWRATANGIEARAALHNHALLCLDEIGEVSERELGTIIYTLANGGGKGRMSRALTARASTQFKLIFLSTGERTLEDVMQTAGRQPKGGQEARLIEIPADAGRGMGIFETLHTFTSSAAMADELSRAAKSHYGTAIRAFLQRLVADSTVAAESTRRMRDYFVRHVITQEASGEEHRVASLFGIIAAAGELATEYGLTGWQKGEATRAADRCWTCWRHNRGGTGAADVMHGIDAVRTFIQVHGNSRFQDCSNADDSTRDRAGFKERDGDEWRYFILPDVFKSEVCRGYDYQAIARELKKRGHLEVGEDRFTYKKRLPGLGNIRVFAILPSLFDDEDVAIGAGITGSLVGTAGN